MLSDREPEHFTYAIIGGGIAGVTCAEHVSDAWMTIMHYLIL